MSLGREFIALPLRILRGAPELTGGAAGNYDS